MKNDDYFLIGINPALPAGRRNSFEERGCSLSIILFIIISYRFIGIQSVYFSIFSINVDGYEGGKW